MSIGYRFTCFGDRDDGHGDVPGLPDHLFCDGTLDDSLAQIQEFLKSWIMSASSTESSEDRAMRHLNISLYGPFPEEECIVDRRSPEQRLADAESPEERFRTLDDAAMSRFEAGAFDEARRYIEELKALLPSFEGDYSYPDASAKVEIVLGRLALREGNIEDAKRHLKEAASGDGSPSMSSFGPNMTLARDLLLAGEKQAVLDYFEECRKFWKFGADDLDDWTMYVNAGRIPDFGGNLVY